MRRLLLARGLSSEEVARTLKCYRLADPKRADANLQQMAGEPRSRLALAVLLPDLLESIGETADPDQALVHWTRYVEGVNRLQLYDYLAGFPRILHLLCTIFGNSPSLSQTLIRDPLLVYWLAEEQVLTRRPARAVLARSLEDMLSHVNACEFKLEALRRFKRREVLRIGVRDLLRLASVPETTAALSDLATVLIEAAYRTVDTHLRGQYGAPRHRDARGRLATTAFSVIALGKLGGAELNYSSDVDLLYVYEADEGATSGEGRQPPIPNEEYFEYLARELTRALAERTAEGYVFRVDLRLRAEGAAGRLARSLAEYKQYYRERGQGWERLALLKARPVAGSMDLGRRFLRAVQPFVFRPDPGTPMREGALSLLAEVKQVKELIDNRMADRGHQRRNVKLGIGGIREIEFIVQAIQVVCGGRLSGIRDRSTLGALDRFGRHGLIPRKTVLALTRAYVFLRDIEHKLQMVHDLQTHALPESPEELWHCALRLGYGRRGRSSDQALRDFWRDYERHTQDVRRLFDELFDTPWRSRLLKAGVALAMRRRPGPENDEGPDG